MGSAFNVTVTAKDAFGNTATVYTGTVHFTSDDGAAVLPANYTFVAGDNGSHQFSVTMNTAGTHSITATDTVTGSITGTRNVSVGGTPPPPPSPQPFAVGTNPGMTATVTMYNPNHTVHFAAQPFGPTYTNGLRVAVGDVTGDGVADVVVVTNGGVRAKAKVINGSTGLIVSGNLLAGSTYTGKVSVAVGDVDGDGKADIVLGTNEGSPRVRVFHGGDFAKMGGFSAGPTAGFLGRTTVGVGDLNNDGKADIVVTSLYTGRSRVAASAARRSRRARPPPASSTSSRSRAITSAASSWPWAT